MPGTAVRTRPLLAAVARISASTAGLSSPSTSAIRYSTCRQVDGSGSICRVVIGWAMAEPIRIANVA